MAGREAPLAREIVVMMDLLGLNFGSGRGREGRSREQLVDDDVEWVDTGRPSVRASQSAAASAPAA